jgi:RHS repeat-associated protein
VSVVNDTDYNVYFDDFEITHKQSSEKINVTSWTDYYPYGKVAKASCSGAGAYRYGYQGEFAEKDSETDWNSFELRQYDSEIGRWLSTDHYGQYWSPYMAMGNDPSNQIDPDGGG